MTESKRANVAKLGLLFLAIACLMVFVFLPLLMVWAYDVGEVQQSMGRRHATEVTVGIATILRAAARRVFRAGARNVMRTTAGAFTRAAVRALTRRVIRLSLHSVIALWGKRVWFDREREPDVGSAQSPSSLAAAILGAVAISFSFAGVVQVIAGQYNVDVVGDFGLRAWEAAALAALPLLIYAAVAMLLAPVCGSQARLSTEIDGLLIQAYFTGAGSFLPMTTDVHYTHGTPAQRAWAAAAVQSAYFVVYVILAPTAELVGSQQLKFLAAIHLIYSFVFIFPIPPLDGYEVWCRSKLGWLALFVPIFSAFLLGFPEELARLL